MPELPPKPTKKCRRTHGEGFDAAMIWGPTHGRKVYSEFDLVNE